MVYIIVYLVYGLIAVQNVSASLEWYKQLCTCVHIYSFSQNFKALALMVAFIIQMEVYRIIA